MNYILDTNAIADLFFPQSLTYNRMLAAIGDGDALLLSQPVYYEVLRGLRRAQASQKLKIFQEKLMPLLQPVSLVDADWDQAARFWADMTKRGRQFSDIDLLLASVVARLDATLVSADADFDALPIKREDWRTG